MTHIMLQVTIETYRYYKFIVMVDFIGNNGNIVISQVIVEGTFITAFKSISDGTAKSTRFEPRYFWTS